MRTTTIASIVVAFFGQIYAEETSASQAQAESLLNRLGLGNARHTKGVKGQPATRSGTMFSDKMIGKLTRNLLKKGKNAPVQVMEENALEKNIEKELSTEQSKGAMALKAMLAKNRMGAMTAQERKVLKEKNAMQMKAEEKAFGESLLENLVAEEKALEGKVAEQKKKAIELATMLEESAEKAKHPLSAAEKKQIREEIDNNSRKYYQEVQEELLEATAMEKLSLGHSLSPAEKKLVEKLEMQTTERIEKSAKAIEEKVAGAKKAALEMMVVLEENAAKATKKPLSEAEKKQNREQIEKNALDYSRQLHEELAQEKIMSKKAFGHPLNSVEQKQMEKYTASLEQQLDLNGLLSALGPLNMGM